jgi:hypothetical protein
VQIGYTSVISGRAGGRPATFNINKSQKEKNTMATNRKHTTHSGNSLSFAVASTVTSEDPLMIGGNLPGVAITDYGESKTGQATVELGGCGSIYDVSVKAITDEGNTTVAIGDKITFTAGDTPALSKKASGKLWGYAIEAIATVGATATIKVMLAESSTAGATTRGTYEQFEVSPIATVRTGGAPEGTTGSENLMSFGKNIFEYHILGTQTILVPVLAAAGLNVAMDQTANDGVEITRGITTRSQEAFVVGTDAFYAKCRFTIGDVSGTDDCCFGFRKVEAYQAAVDSYDAAAFLNVISGDIYIETMDGGATTSTDTTDNWADLAEHELAVYVSAAGAVTYTIDGVAPSTTAAFSFAAAEVVIPFFYFLNDTDLVDTLYISEWESGLQ